MFRILLSLVMLAGCDDGRMDPPPDAGNNNMMPPGKSCGAVIGAGGGSDVGELAVDATSVFFTQNDRIMAVPKANGGVVTVVPAVSATRMITFGDELFFIDSKLGLRAARKSDGMLQTLSAQPASPTP